MVLDEKAREILRLLVELLPNADPEKPQKMVGYKKVHDLLGLANVRGDWGDSLKAQGLESLAEWTKFHGKPAITGIIVNQESYSPGAGYYSLFGRQNDDWPWWRSQVLAAKAYDWSPDIGKLHPPQEPDQATVRVLIGRILAEYGAAVSEPFAAHTLAEAIRSDLPRAISNWISDSARYQTRGSPGQGGWAAVPWAAVMDCLITETVQGGYYLVYLFCADGSGVHLSLNQGVTNVREQYGSGTQQALKVRANDFLSRLGNIADGLSTGPIDLVDDSGPSLGSLYEAGSICSVFYPTGNVPPEQQLRNDFNRFMSLYEELSAKDERLFAGADVEDDEQGLEDEDVRTLREHKRIERNRKLANKAKKFHGYICKACGFDFEKSYGDIGKNFIEAHHLTPLSKLKGQKVKLSPEWDFTVLCSNCHRMIHKTENVGNVMEFRAAYLTDKG